MPRALSCCTFPSPWDILAIKWQLSPLLQPRGGTSLPVCIFVLPSWNNFYTKPSEDSTGCPLEVTDTASRGRAWEDPEAESVNLEPKLLGSVPCKFKIYRRLCCSHHTMTFRPTIFLFFAAFRSFLKWWRVQDFRNINVSLLEIAKFSTMTLWKLTVQFIDSVLRFSINLVSELSQSYFCLIEQYQHALTPCLCTMHPWLYKQEQGSCWPVSPGTLWLVSLFHNSRTKVSLLCKSKITLKLHSGSWT